MPRTKSISIEAAASLFMADRKAQGMAAGTIRFYAEKLRNFYRWTTGAGVALLSDLSSLDVRKYFAYLSERGYAPNTQNLEGRAVRAFLRWCIAESLTTADPLRNVKIPQPPKEVKPALQPRDIQAMLATADARARAMILVLLDTGVRSREFIDLNSGDVDLNAGTVRVRRGKTGKTRTVFISLPTVKALLAYYREQGFPDDGDPLWRNQRTNERLTDSGMRQVLNSTAKDAGVKGAKPHAFRRTFALWSIRQGVDIHTLARLMGHASIEVLKTYLDLDDTDSAEAHRKANIVGNFLK